MTCPQCGAVLTDPGGWPPWCDVCDWGVDPEPHELHGSVLLRWWQRRVDTAVRGEHQRLTNQPDALTGRDALRWVTFVTAVGVHAVTIGLVAAAVVAALSEIPLVLKIVIAAVCIGLVLTVAPRPSLRRRQAEGWSRTDAPQTFALLDAIAASVDGVTPARVVVTDAFASTLVGNGARRTLLVGLPLWRALAPGQRVAMLAHLLSKPVHDDPRRSAVVSTALRSLDDWLSLSRPTEMEQRVAARRRRRVPRRFSSEFRLSDALIPLGLSPFYVVVLSIGAALRLTAIRCAHRAVYAADAVAASVAGAGATRGWLDVALMRDSVEGSMALALRNDRGSDLLSVAGGYPTQLPERERQRLRRRDTLRAEGAGRDEPPLSYRWTHIADGTAHASISDPTMAGADAELTRAEPDVRRKLRTRLVDSGL